MGDIEVTSLGVQGVLDKLSRGEWMVPEFQRDFVWSVADVEDLIASIFAARPIGMATLWEQADNSGLKLGRISLPDTVDGARGEVVLGNSNEPVPNRHYAILDGRQRCTAIAMAFGGLRPQSGRRKFAGRFFLRITESDAVHRVEFIKSADANRLGIDSQSGALSKGLVPLEVAPGKKLVSQWIEFTQLIRSPSIYPDGEMPQEEELDYRSQVLTEAFEGVNRTQLAVYTVPPEYDLGDICEIFETLNTTGTKVSTVDLIHSWLYADTSPPKSPEALLLREWIDDLGGHEGAIGWASSTKRPELVAQIVTACHVASKAKFTPRTVGGKKDVQIRSVKAGDLLATPTEHWRRAIKNTDLLAGWIGDFQRVVANGYFPQDRCPYPASAAIYVALRWHRHFDSDSEHAWTVDDLDMVYRAFFWRNSLAGRYDQGFLTQIGTDIIRLRDLLERRAEAATEAEWVALAQNSLDALVNKPLPTTDQVAELARDGTTAGALRRALVLPMWTQVDRDLLDRSVVLSYPEADGTQLHHIFPRAWCRDNAVGELKALLDERDQGVDWVGSPANLVPLSGASNRLWRASRPGQVLEDVPWTARSSDFARAYIDQRAFELLRGDDDRADLSHVGEFWRHRASLIARDLTRRMDVVLS